MLTKASYIYLTTFHQRLERSLITPVNYLELHDESIPKYRYMIRSFFTLMANIVFIVIIEVLSTKYSNYCHCSTDLTIRIFVHI